VRIKVERLNLDAASFRQLFTKHGGDGDAVRAEVLQIVRTRGKMHNPVTGSGGMLVGTVEEWPRLATQAAAGRPRHHAGLADAGPTADHRRPARLGRPVGQVPAAGHAILFGRSIVAVIPDDLPTR
jgi:L-erythro-3,5-diaminohexanoate dehydrogenase